MTIYWLRIYTSNWILCALVFLFLLISQITLGTTEVQEHGKIRSGSTFDIGEGTGKQILGNTHEPIRINGNADFANQASANGWIGNGTSESPYIIENNEIDSQGGPYCIWIENTTVWFVIRNCTMWNATNSTAEPWGTGIYLKNVTNGTLVNNNCSHNSVTGIALFFSSTNNLTKNNCSNNSHGILFHSSSHNNIIANNCSNNYCDGIHLCLSNDTTIANNTCSSNSRYGIVLESSSGNIISKNICSYHLNTTNFDRYGIFITYFDPFVSSTNNTITENDCSDNNGGIVVSWSNFNSILHNNCTNNYWGIYVDHVQYNNIAYNNCSGNFWCGIDLWGLWSNNITNNTCMGNYYHGILVACSIFTCISNNTCSGNFEDGLIIYSSSNNTIANNNCSANSRYGLYCLNESNNNTIITNTFYCNTNYGVFITNNAKNNIIHHNYFYQNNGAGKGVNGNCQAYDDVGGNYWYDNTAQEGNYWSNWDGSGWGTPNAYPIDGGAGACDMYPIGNPAPEFSPFGVIVSTLGLLGIAAFRRRK